MGLFLSLHLQAASISRIQLFILSYSLTSSHERGKSSGPRQWNPRWIYSKDMFYWYAYCKGICCHRLWIFRIWCVQQSRKKKKEKIYICSLYLDLILWSSRVFLRKTKRKKKEERYSSPLHNLNSIKPLWYILLQNKKTNKRKNRMVLNGFFYHSFANDTAFIVLKIYLIKNHIK